MYFLLDYLYFSRMKKDYKKNSYVWVDTYVFIENMILNKTFLHCQGVFNKQTVKWSIKEKIMVYEPRDLRILGVQIKVFYRSEEETHKK